MLSQGGVQVRGRDWSRGAKSVPDAAETANDDDDDDGSQAEDPAKAPGDAEQPVPRPEPDLPRPAGGSARISLCRMEKTILELFKILFANLDDMTIPYIPVLIFGADCHTSFWSRV